MIVAETGHRAPLRLTLLGAPRTKKNHGRRVYSFRKRRTFSVPSLAYEEWCARVKLQLARVDALPDRPYNVAAIFYRDARTGDAVGYYQALADALEAAGVVSNDRWIVSWDGSRLALDRTQPRVEVLITPAEDVG